MPDVRVVHTADLEPATLRAARALMDVAFGGEFGDDDWEHTLGGMHALAEVDGVLVAHGAVVQRRLLHAGRPLRAGYVEGVAVHPDHRRRGLGGLVMDPLERIIRAAYDTGALSPTEDGAALYRARGWVPWRGPTSTLGPEGPVRTPEDDDAVFVLPVTVALDPSGPLACDWRAGDAW